MSQQQKQIDWHHVTFNEVNKRGDVIAGGDKLDFHIEGNILPQESREVTFSTIRQEGEDFFTHECISWAEYYYVYGNRFNKTLTTLPRLSAMIFAKKVGLVDVSLRFEKKRDNRLFVILTHQWPKRPPYIRRFLHTSQTQKI